MLKTLNGIMLRILENCNHTRVFVVLIRLLTNYKNSAEIPKMPGLIIRCLLKMTKIMSPVLMGLEIDKLLLAMHEYLTKHKITSGTDEMGTKTIKTMLNEIVKLIGKRVWEYYDAVKMHPE